MTSPYFVLCRAFFAQFFTDESVTSDVHLRQTMILVLAFLLPPGVFLMILLFPEFQAAVIRAKFLRGPASYVDDLLMWIALLFTTYSTVATGLITVLAWDALTFDHRDAVVLGALPLERITILGAKLSALAAFLLAASIPVNLLNAAAFALETSDQVGGAPLFRHFVALLFATVGASVLIFAAIVLIRATVTLLGGPRLASACGPPLQFLFVVGLLCLMIFCPFVLHISFVSAAFTNWMPSAWFVGVFERLRGSPRALDPAFPFLLLARRALVATPVAILGAVIMSVVEFRHQMRLALAPSSSPGLLGAALVSRTLARLIVGRHPPARATSDFILLTLARNRAQQATIAVNAALGSALVIAALSSTTRHLEALLHPRTAVLWIPLVMAYWMTIGLRASFFVPSELPASWTFSANAPAPALACWSAVRASMITFVVPRTLMITAVLIIPIGWQAAAWHALLVTAVVVLLIEIVALTVDFIPFTRAYRPGHAKVRTRWWAYVLGVYVFAYWPIWLELRILNQPGHMLQALACTAVAVALLEVVGRWRAATRSVRPEEPPHDLTALTVLDIGGIAQGVRS